MIKKIFSLLEKDHQPTMLEIFSKYTPFQMLIMTLLSSRTKDTTTIPIVKRMFKKWKQPQDFIKINDKELEQEIFGIGFYKVKAKHIKKLSEIILEKYNGKIPDTLEELTTLPGVGRKTANCVLAYTFHKAAIAVDVHVHRIANRLGWVKTIKVEDTEEKLKKIIPKKDWYKVNMLFVDHGQRVCLPIKPKCKECSVNSYCEYGKKRIRR